MKRMDTVDVWVMGLVLLVLLLAFCSGGCKGAPYGDVNGFTYDGEEGGGVRMGWMGESSNARTFSDAAAADSQRLVASTLALTEQIEDLTAYLREDGGGDEQAGEAEAPSPQAEQLSGRAQVPSPQEARVIQALEALQEGQARLGRLMAWNMRRTLKDDDPFARILDRELDRLQSAAEGADEAADRADDAAEEAEIGVEDLREAREELEQWSLETVFLLFLIGGFLALCVVGYKVGQARDWGRPK